MEITQHCRGCGEDVSIDESYGLRSDGNIFCLPCACRETEGERDHYMSECFRLLRLAVKWRRIAYAMMGVAVGAVVAHLVALSR